MTEVISFAVVHTGVLAGSQIKVKNFRVVNVIASTKLDTRIDLVSLSSELRDVQYNPQAWSGMVWRRTNPKSTIIMFATGKITSVGTKSEEEARVAIETAVNRISKPPRPHYDPPTIENVVATADLGRYLDVEFLAATLKGAIYEPDQFPSLIYRDGGIVLLVSSSGKVVSVGAKGEKAAKKAIKDLVRTIESREGTKK
jgi:transcription initiation factor TFIID TATA-box-binding protein